MLPEPVPGLAKPHTGPLVDRFGRQHDMVRISVTDRCNYRCTYCMPAEGLKFLPKSEVLSFEEITRIVRVLARCGVHTVRLTGGEPTVRRDLERLIESIARIDGIRDIALSTNGHLFAPRARAFADAGLKRINVSLDSLDSVQFTRITRGGDLNRVLEAIDAARDAGLGPIKVNAVIIGGENEDQVHPLVERFAKHSDTIVRFIEWMPFSGADPTKRHIPGSVLRKRLPGLVPHTERLGAGPAKYWQFPNGQLVGFISPITEHFCHTCNRLRIQADGHLRTCLSRESHESLRDILRGGASDAALEAEIRERLWGKVAGHEADKIEGWKAFEGPMTTVGG